MTPDELKKRTRKFGVAVFKFARTLPTDPATLIVVRQMVSSGSSVGANYRSACRAKSRPDFISKMTTAEEEADETQYWFEFLVEGEVIAKTAAAWFIEEAEQLVKIFVASIKTARGYSR
ncbi:MAG TPA: four helix bundle protein [Vicinamibacterales bacterium]|nr:four helix bundle protein [Vicinamibacterales bacterium]